MKESTESQDTTSEVGVSETQSDFQNQHVRMMCMEWAIKCAIGNGIPFAEGIVETAKQFEAYILGNQA